MQPIFLTVLFLSEANIFDQVTNCYISDDQVGTKFMAFLTINYLLLWKSSPLIAIFPLKTYSESLQKPMVISPIWLLQSKGTEDLLKDV
jgi:hypothetical protein